MKHALIVNNENEFGLQDAAVYIFESEEAAEKFAVETLVKAGELYRENGKLLSQDRQAVYDTDTEALEDWQWQLGSSEMFHVYRVLEAPK